ncbi:MAG: hypothetical protein HY719_04725 [Planctomycetes bacterium]|nr:hypothetical protein [Planctomycetota bacterium]
MKNGRGGIEEINKAIQVLIASQRKTDEQLRKTDEQLRKTDEQLRKTDEQLRKTDKQVAKLNRDIGRFFNGWGEFVESLVAPAIPKIFAPLGFRIDDILRRHEARRNSRIVMEVDIIANGVWNGGSPVTIAVSVKSHLATGDVRDHVVALRKFFKFYPQYAGRTLLGAVAGIRLDKDVSAFSRRQGLHLIGSSGDAVELVNSKGF